ncbi:DUF1707 domain-containing protein [Spirillospora sp. NPDC029432]|uniref:DUF1707 SHOCT-like domain-containing protein n=1 Tax=Spirillospora sp. NPDC029432 TaxID=3154599 RepID=UPI003454D853
MNPSEPSDPSPAPAPAPAPASTPASAPASAMRASDADRDRVADRLREALAEGRITPEEHAERIDVVYAAKTYAELEPVLSDLPGGHAPPAPRVRLDKDLDGDLDRDPAGDPGLRLPAPEKHAASIVAVFSGADRRGRWLVEPSTTVSCLFGGAELDFRQAVLSQREVTLNVTCVFGGVDITVPPGVRLVNSVSAVFGGVDLPDDDTTDPDAPVIRITGMVLFGGVSASRREAGSSSRADRRRERHDRHRALRDLQREVHERHREDMTDMRELHDERREHLRRLRESRRRHC